MPADQPPDNKKKKINKVTAAFTILAVGAAAVIIPVALNPELLSQGGPRGAALIATEVTASPSQQPDDADTDFKTRYDLILERIENEQNNPAAAYEYEYETASENGAEPPPVYEEDGLVGDSTEVGDASSADAGGALASGDNSLTQQAYNPGSVYMTSPVITSPSPSGTGELVSDMTIDINGDEVTAQETTPSATATVSATATAEPTMDADASEVVTSESPTPTVTPAPTATPTADTGEQISVPDTTQDVASDVEGGSSDEETIEAITEQALIRLMQLGYTPYYSLGEDYDPTLAQLSIIYFQRNNGLPVTGMIDEDTFYAIMAETAPTYVIGPGVEGEDVRQIQELLNAIGYPLTATGIFDAETEAAVLALKQDNGLDLTSTVDAALRDALIATLNPDLTEQQVQEG